MTECTLTHHKQPSQILFSFFLLFLSFFLVAACKVLVPQPGMEPKTPAVETQSLNHWTARKISHIFRVSLNCESTLLDQAPGDCSSKFLS